MDRGRRTCHGVPWRRRNPSHMPSASGERSANCAIPACIPKILSGCQDWSRAKKPGPIEGLSTTLFVGERPVFRAQVLEFPWFANSKNIARYRVIGEFEEQAIPGKSTKKQSWRSWRQSRRIISPTVSRYRRHHRHHRLHRRHRRHRRHRCRRPRRR